MSKKIVIIKDKRYKPISYTITCGGERRFCHDIKELTHLLIKFLEKLE